MKQEPELNALGQTFGEALESQFEQEKSISIIEKLNANNLPELIGWKEKQETLLKENPYVEITGPGTYDLACKSRTNLLKGRTELEKQDKAIASKVAAFRKEVAGKTQELIEITLTAEQTQQTEVKRWEGIKEAERAEKERLENERIDAIKNKALEMESSALSVIQKMTYSGIISDSDKVSEIMHTQFDFEEFDILYTNAFSRVRSALDEKIKDLTQRENDRIAKEAAEKEAENERFKNNLQSSRLTAIQKYISFGAEIDITILWTYTDEEFETILKSKKDLFDANEKAENERKEKEESDKKAQEEKAKKEKDYVFNVRKNRLFEAGMVLTEDVFTNPNLFLGISCHSIYECDVIEFENILSDCKKSIKESIEKQEKAKAQKEADEKASKADAAKLKAENKARVKRLADDKNWLSGELEKYFSLAPLEYLTENQETKDFIKSASQRIESLKSELLTELEKL